MKFISRYHFFLICLCLFLSLLSLSASPMDPKENLKDDSSSLMTARENTNREMDQRGSISKREGSLQVADTTLPHLNQEGRETPTSTQSQTVLVSATPSRKETLDRFNSQGGGALNLLTGSVEEREVYYKQLKEAYEKSYLVMSYASEVDTALSFDIASARAGEYEALAELWRNVGWGVSCLLNEKNQLKQLQNQNPLNFNKIKASQQAVEDREQIVKYLSQGANVMHELLHLIWGKYKPFTIDALSQGKDNSLNEEYSSYLKEESYRNNVASSYLKEEFYRNNVASFQLLAADPVEDKEIVSLLQEVADVQYAQINLVDNIVTDNNPLLVLCSELHSLGKEVSNEKKANERRNDLIIEIKTLIKKEEDPVVVVETSENILSPGSGLRRRILTSENQKHND